MKYLNDWITVKPNGKENKGRPLFVEKGESKEDAIKRKFPKKQKSETKTEKEKKNEINIIKETEKAKLLEKDGKEFWIQKKWQREDGTLTPAGEKAFDKAKTKEQIKKEKKEISDRKKIGVARPEKADYESEKAYGYDLKVDIDGANRILKERIFIPKSVIQENGNIPTWILEKKIDEIWDKYERLSPRGSFLVTSPFEDLDDEKIRSGILKFNNSIRPKKLIKVA